jgi:hypothetical protein
MSGPHLVSTHGFDSDEDGDRAVDRLITSVDPDNIWLDTTYSAEEPMHYNDYIAHADTSDLHAALRHQEQDYSIRRLA